MAWRKSCAAAEKFEYVGAWVQGRFKMSPEDLKNLIEAEVLQVDKAGKA